MMEIIALDWGTTTLRGYRISNRGKIIERHTTDMGILKSAASGFEHTLSLLLNKFSELPTKPVIIASGMITSKNGWYETPYLECPLAVEDLGHNLYAGSSEKLGTIWFVPGVKQFSPQPDIMRGEETQLAGLDSSSVKIALLPGTHSKWVEMNEGRIHRFTTYMTGDLFDAVRHYTILRTLPNTNWTKESFQQGVKTGYNGSIEGENLLSQLFQVRVKAILDNRKIEIDTWYLSGLLIGSEIGAAQKAGYTKDQELIVIGSESLTELYTIALRSCGHNISIGSENLAAKGMYLMAKTRQLI